MDNDIICLVGCNKELSNKMPISSDRDYMFVGAVLYWLCQGEMGYLNKFSKHSEIMLMDIHTLGTRRPAKYLPWLTTENLNVKKYLQKEIKGIENTFTNPLGDQIKFFDYFMCSFAYMIAESIILGYKKIEIYGSSMLYMDDLVQKNNFECWITYAMGLGIKVVTQPESGLLQAPLRYGYDAINTPGVMIKKKIDMMKGLIDLGLLTLERDVALLDISVNEKKQMLKLVKGVMRNFEILYKDELEFKREIYDRHGIIPEPITENDGEEFLL